MTKDEKTCELNLGASLMRASGLLKRRLVSTSYVEEVHKLTGQNGWILQYLSHQESLGKIIFQKDLEENLAITRSAISKALKGLEQKGLITREAVASDARLKQLVLTEKGRYISAHAQQELTEIENQLTRGLSLTEQQELLRLIGLVSENLLEDMEY